MSYVAKGVKRASFSLDDKVHMQKVGEVTLQDRKLIQAYIRTGSKAAAAREALNTKSKNPTQIANHHFNKPVVQKELQQALVDHGLTKDYVLNNMKVAMESGIGKDAKNSDAIRVLEDLAKMNGMMGNDSTQFKMSISAKANEVPYAELLAEYRKMRNIVDGTVQEGETVASTS